MPIVKQPFLTQVGNALQQGANLYQGQVRGRQARQALENMGMGEFSGFIDPVTGEMSQAGAQLGTAKLRGDAWIDAQDARARALDARMRLRHSLAEMDREAAARRNVRLGVSPEGKFLLPFEDQFTGLFGSDAGVENVPPDVRGAVENYYIDPTKYPKPQRLGETGAGGNFLQFINPFSDRGNKYKYSY